MRSVALGMLIILESIVCGLTTLVFTIIQKRTKEIESIVMDTLRGALIGALISLLLSIVVGFLSSLIPGGGGGGAIIVFVFVIFTSIISGLTTLVVVVLQKLIKKLRNKNSEKRKCQNTKHLDIPKED